MPVIMVTPVEAKLHLRVDHDDEDDLIAALIAAAYSTIEGYIFRKIYETEIARGEDVNGILVDEAINAAVLLVVAHLYANREAVTNYAARDLPMGVEWLITRYRDYSQGC